MYLKFSFHFSLIFYVSFFFISHLYLHLLYQNIRIFHRQFSATIDRMHKWRLTKYSFVFVLIRPTSLVLKEHFFCILSLLTRLVSLISTKTKEYFFGRHLCIRSIGALTEDNVFLCKFFLNEDRKGFLQLMNVSGQLNRKFHAFSY